VGVLIRLGESYYNFILLIPISICQFKISIQLAALYWQTHFTGWLEEAGIVGEMLGHEFPPIEVQHNQGPQEEEPHHLPLLLEGPHTRDRLDNQVLWSPYVWKPLLEPTRWQDCEEGQQHNRLPSTQPAHQQWTDQEHWLHVTRATRPWILFHRLEPLYLLLFVRRRMLSVAYLR
jgi:hypothetical protein